jgi:RNA polymerase sigma factor (sigma-70 family)
MINNKDYSTKDIAFVIEECRKGNRRAQFEIYKRYAKAMYNTSLRIVNNPYDAEDVIQEAFISGFKKLNEYSGKVTFGAWIKKIVIHKSIDHIRKSKRMIHLTEHIAEQIENKDDTTYHEDDKIIHPEIEQIKRGIQKLPDGYKIILSLYLIEGYDHEEISQILNISGSTSRSQFVRAKKKLTEIVKSNS